MGSLRVPLISEIFVNLLEREVFTSTCMLTQYVGYWHKYVDNVLCPWTGPVDQLKNFLGFPNSLHPSIKFTLDIGGKIINFLDLSITLNAGKHEFGIFRKPTYTDITTDGSSYAPPPPQACSLPLHDSSSSVHPPNPCSLPKRNGHYKAHSRDQSRKIR
jgi:hypothetical protein